MKGIRSFLALLCVLIIAHGSSRATVYLNWQWDEEHEAWYCASLVLQGTGLSLDREYQNAYGMEMGLPPGPPFIIEYDIIIENIYDAERNVESWGSLVITTTGEGTGPFILQFSPATLALPSIRTEGPVHIIGTSSDPILFRGRYNIQSTEYDTPDDDPESFDIEFTHCCFDSVGYYGDIPAVLIDLEGGNVEIENCRFSNFVPDALFRVIDFTSDPMRDPYWSFTMRGCLFSDIVVRNRHAVFLGKHIDEVTIEDNEFVDVAITPDPPRSAPVGIDDCFVRNILANTGHDNLVSAIYINSDACPGNCLLQSTPEVPLVVRRFIVGEESAVRVGAGSVLKMYDVDIESNYEVAGRLEVESAAFTSYEDDSFGGDTDLAPQPPQPETWGYNDGGIHVLQTGSLSLLNTTIRYAHNGIETKGAMTVSGCTFERNEGHCLYCNATGAETYRITHSTFTRNDGYGISFTNQTGISQTLIVDNVNSCNNTRGISLACGYGGLAEIDISRSVFSGNSEYGVYLKIGTGITGLVMENCIVSGNMMSGMRGVDSGGDAAPLRIESCIFAGNGHRPGGGSEGHGIEINAGNLRFVNNTIACNRTYGLYHEPNDASGSEIANCIFYGNLNYGYVKDERTLPRFAYNLFQDNDDADELWFGTDSGDLSTVEEVQALGGDYATNRHHPPGFAPLINGVASAIAYLDSINRSILVHGGLDPGDADIEQLIIKPDRGEDPWYFIEGCAGDTIMISGDITETAAAGDTFEIFDHHLGPSSPLVDVGDSDAVLSALDIDGDLRRMNGDGAGGAEVDIGADERNPQDFTLIVLAPEEDTLWTAGEERYIEWSAVGVDSVRILWAARCGGACAFDTAAAAVPASAKRFLWTVPDTLSAHCLIRLQDSADPARTAESPPFKIKGCRLTRLDAALEYEPFALERDDWQFANAEENMWPETWWSRFDYENGTDPVTGEAYPFYFTGRAFLDAVPSNFPDWPLFVDAFGATQCYINTPSGPLHRPSAVLRWAALKGDWGGSCFGFAVSGLCAFDDRAGFLADFPEVEAFDRLHELSLDDDHRRVINELFLYQYGAGFRGRVDSLLSRTPHEALNDVREMLLRENNDHRWLFIGDNYGSGAHAVVPWKVEPFPSIPCRTKIFVYDSNRPGDSTAAVSVDTCTGTWYYTHLAGWGGDSLLAVMDRAGNYTSAPVLSGPRVRGSWPRVRAQSESGPGDGIDFYNSPGIAIDIADGAGHAAGFADSCAYNTIPEGAPIIPFTGGYHPPVGYSLPARDYLVTMGAFPDSIVSLYAFTGSVAFCYARREASPAETDRIEWGDTVTVINTDPNAKQCDLEMITIEGDGERVIDVAGFSLGWNDSVSIEAPDDTTTLINHGAAASYSLMLRRISEYADGIFEHADLSIAASSCHRIVPDWSDLESTPVTILIDLDCDGAADDSVIAENEYVATLLRDYDIDCRKHYIEIRWRLTERDEGTEFMVLRSTDAGDPFKDTGVEVHDEGLSFRAIDSHIEYDATYRYRVDVIGGGRRRVLFETEPVSTPRLPVTLFQNYPNPFNPATTISFYLPARTHVHLAVYNIEGKRIAVLVDGMLTAGLKKIEWGGKNARGGAVESGIYFYRLRAGKRVLTRKLVLIR
jgi:hypothetical protein